MRRPTATRATLAGLLLCAAALGTLAPDASAQSYPEGSELASPILGSSQTQAVHLRPGVNLVSLHVEPDARRMGSLLNGVSDALVLVKDQDGLIYAPDYGVTDLLEWAWGRAYLVNVEDAVTLEVEGPTIDPASSIPLRQGWNWIPYFLDRPLPVDSALASLGPALERVEDAHGRAYPAEPGHPQLTELEPGSGYRVRVSAPATLVYSEATAPPASPPPASPPPGTPPPGPANAPPVVAGPVAVSATAGEPVRVDVLAAASDPDGDPLVVASVGAPAHGTAAVSADGLAVFYMPAAGYDGTDAFDFVVTDGRGGEAVGTVDASVSTTAAPAWTIESLAVEGTVGDPDYTLDLHSVSTGAATFALMGHPASVSLDPDGHTLRVAFSSEQEGQFTIVANNPGGDASLPASLDAQRVAPPPPSGGSPARVASLAEALALTDLVPGQTVVVEGYYAPGDGGGGEFLVSDGGETPDGGLVFVPESAQSPVVTETFLNARSARYFGLLPAGENVVFGSLTLEPLDPSGGGPLLSIEDRHLHGFQWHSRFTALTELNHEQGFFHDRRERLEIYYQHLYGGDGLGYEVRVTYRHTTSPLRLVRQGVTDTLRPEWFGARTHDADPAFDNQPVINWTIKAAERLNAETPGRITTILFSQAAVYEYFGSIRLPDGVTLKGAGGTELVTVTDDLGLTYSPVRLKPARTTLRVKDGEALTYIRMLKDESDPYYLPWDVKMVLDSRITAIYPRPGAMSMAVEDIHLDGNWEGNEGAWTEGWSTHAEREAWMRNAPGWTGVAASPHRGLEVPVGQQVTLRNVGILGYGATGILGHPNGTWDAENVLLGNTQWNHSLYAAKGTFTNLTFTGFAWNHVAFDAGTINNLVLEGMTTGRRDDSFFFHYRGADAYDQAEVLADANGYFLRSDGTLVEAYAHVNGGHIDMRGLPYQRFPFVGTGKALTVRDVVVVQHPNAGSLYQERGNGYQKSQYPHNRFVNVTVHGGGSLFDPLHVTRSVFEDVRMTDALVGGSEAKTALSLQALYRSHPSYLNPTVNVFDGVRMDRPHQFVSVTKIDPASPGADYFVINSSFDNTDVVYRDNAGGGTVANSGGGTADQLRVYWRDVEFNVKTGGNAELYLATTHFERVRDRATGQTSEDAGTASFTATSGQSYVDVPTTLWSLPMAPEYVSVAGADAGLVSAVVGVQDGAEYPLSLATNTSGDRRAPSLRFYFNAPLEAGQSVSFDWSAAIKPWPAGVTVPDTAAWVE